MVKTSTRSQHFYIAELGNYNPDNKDSVHKMDVETQPPTQPGSKNGQLEEEPSEEKPESEINGNANEKEMVSPKTHTRGRKARSRSRTPAKKGKKNEEDTKSNLPETKKNKKIEDGTKNCAEDAKVLTVTLQKIVEDVNNEEIKSKEITQKVGSSDLESTTVKICTAVEITNQKESKKSEDHVEMDPLVLATDEPDPELQFDENSDMESGKGSPVLNRCKTRRSQNRNVPTPKTPKSIDSDSEKNSVPPTPDPSESDTKPENLIDTNDSTDVASPSIDITNLSTRPQIGSDETRVKYLESNSLLTNDDSYINECRERSLSDTLRGLSARRSIRPISEDYRKRAFQNSVNKFDLNATYPSRKSVESVITGVKRKGRSITPEERKKFKSDSPGFGSLFVSPINSLRNKLSDVVSSTPKLTGYKDDNKNFRDQDLQVLNGTEKSSWCLIM